MPANGADRPLIGYIDRGGGIKAAVLESLWRMDDVAPERLWSRETDREKLIFRRRRLGGRCDAGDAELAVVGTEPMFFAKRPEVGLH